MMHDHGMGQVACYPNSTVRTTIVRAWGNQCTLLVCVSVWSIAHSYSSNKQERNICFWLAAARRPVCLLLLSLPHQYYSTPTTTSLLSSQRFKQYLFGCLVVVVSCYYVRG